MEEGLTGIITLGNMKAELFQDISRRWQGKAGILTAMCLTASGVSEKVSRQIGIIMRF